MRNTLTTIALAVLLLIGTIFPRTNTVRAAGVPGDINLDNCVNQYDLNDFFPAMRTTYEARFDANNDSKIDVFDVAMIGGHFVGSCISDILPVKPHGVYQLKLDHGGITRTYTMFVPVNIFGNVPTNIPLVYNLHGGGSNGVEQMNLTFMNAVAGTQKFLAVYPDAVNGRWNDGRAASAAKNNNADDVGFIAAITAKLASQLSVNQLRVYVTGISNGGMMAYRIACENASAYAAVAPVSSGMPDEIVPSCSPTVPIALIAMQGDSDPYIPYTGGLVYPGNEGTVQATDTTIAYWVSHNACNPTPTATALPDSNTTDHSTATKYIYDTCGIDGDVNFYKIAGGGHTWPGGPQYRPVAEIGYTNLDFNASLTMWDFFKTHTR